MAEKPTCYLGHHWRNAQSWARIPGAPEEAAISLIRQWNNPANYPPDSDQPFRTYPLTPAFIGALAGLITAVRRGEIVILLPDGPDGPPDALCLARGGCGKLHNKLPFAE